MPEPPTEHGGSIKRFAGLVFALTLLSACATFRGSGPHGYAEAAGDYGPVSVDGKALPQLWDGRSLREVDVLRLKEDGTAEYDFPATISGRRHQIQFGGVYALTEVEGSAPDTSSWGFSLQLFIWDGNGGRRWNGTLSQGVLALFDGEAKATFKRLR